MQHKLNRLPTAIFLMFSLVSALAGSAIAQDKDLSGNYVWKPVKIGAGGWMRGMAVSPSDATRRYARGDVDNVYRWDDSAQQWHPTKLASAFPAKIAAAPAEAGCGAIAIDPKDPNHVLVVFTLGVSGDLSATNPSFNLNVYDSTDGAVMFKPANLSLQGSLSQETTGERIAIDPNNGQVAYLGPPGAQGFPDGLQRSLDGGATWNPVTGGGLPASTASVRYEFALPRFNGASGTTSANGQVSTKTIYVTYIKHDETNGDAVLSGGVVKSADGGLTWTDITDTNVSNPGNAINFATVDSAGDLWISDGSNNIYKYSAAGVWTTFATPYGGGGGIAVDASNANRVFATSGDGLARSLDGGKTWTSLGANFTYSSSQPIEWLRPSSYRPQNHYISESGLYLDPAGNLWMPSGNDGILTTTPNDATDSSTNPPIWSSSSVGIEEMVAQVGVIPPGGKPVLTVEDETLFTISDPDTFTAQHFPISLWNGNNGLSTGTGVSYAPNQPQYVAEVSDNLEAGNPLLQSSQYSGYSTDGGDTWNLFQSITAGTHPCVLYGGTIAVSARQKGHEGDPAGADNLVWIPSNFNDFSHFGQGPASFYSKDGGATWTQTASFNNAAGAISVPSPCNFGPNGYTYMGFQWGPWIFALAQNLLVADPVTPGTFYAHLDAGGFWKSTDGGSTWVQEPATGSPGLPQHGQLAAVPGVSGDMWLVDGSNGATQHGLYHTVDGGNSFTRNPNFDFAWALALGKSSSGQTYPAIYVYGRLTGDFNWGIFQSVDGGTTFNRVSYYPYGLLDVPSSMTASWDVFGTVYVGFGGNSYYYGRYYAPNVLPGAPVLSATAGDGSVALSWQTSSNGGTPTGFDIYRGTVAGAESPTPIASGIDANTYTDQGLTDGTAYYYKMVAVNGVGSGPASNEVAATPSLQPPAVPVGVAAFPGDSQVLISWATVSKAMSYRIYRGISAGAEGTPPFATTSSTSYLDQGLVNGSTYYYTVQAVDAAGASAHSAEVAGKPTGYTSSTAQIARATTPPVLDGSLSAIWNTTATYALGNLVGTIPAGQSNSATWQGLWDATNLYVLVNVLDSAVIANSDSVEVYVDGNNGKATSYTNLDWQYLFQYGNNQVQQYSGGNQGTNTVGVTYGQAAVAGGYRIVAAIPWSTLGVSPGAHDLIGIDVAINNFYVAGARANKLFWNSTVDLDYTDPSLFGTAELLTGAATPQVATPTFTPAAGSYTSAQTVQIQSSTKGAAIHYTTDGSIPTSTHGSVYTGAIEVAATTQVKAVASLTGELDSVVAVANYTINIPVQTAAPTIEPGSGTYSSTVNVTLATATTGATIRYTTDGSIPSEAHGTVYSGPVTIPVSLTLKAIAYVAGQTDSQVVSAAYVIQGATGLPAGWTDLDIGTPALAGSGTHQSGVWSITGAGADIFGEADQFNFAERTLSGDATLVARAVAITETDSWAKAGVALRGTTAAGAIYAGVFVTPANGVVFQWRNASNADTSYIQLKGIAPPTLDNPVWVKVEKKGATYAGLYSLDGKSYTQMGSPVVLEFPAAVFYAGLAVTSHDPGQLNTADFTNVSVKSAPGRVARPVLSPTGGSFTTPQLVTIVSLTAGAMIRYTLDGTIPSTNRGSVYSHPFTVHADSVLRAVAYLPGETTSSVASARFSFELPTSWSEEDIGLPSIDGSAAEVKGIWTVAGAGEDIFGSSDQVGFPSRPIAGDSSISAKLTSFTGTNPWVKAGLMYRDSDCPGSPNVAVLATGADGIVVQWRSKSSGSTSYEQAPGVPVPSAQNPLWLKLSRSGDTYTAYYSMDGSAYAQAGPSIEVDCADNPSLVGLAVTSHDPSALHSVIYKDVEISEVEKQVVTPVFSPRAGTYSESQTASITTPTPDATIRYTLDGTIPTTTAGTVYSGPVAVASSATIHAIAYESGDIASAVASAAYTIASGPAVPNGLYTIVNRNSDRDLNDYSFGTSSTQLHQYDLQVAQNTEFNLVNQPDGTVTFAEQYTSVVIGVAGSTATGSPVDVETPASPLGGGQEWILVSTGGGYFKIVNELSGLDMDVSAGSTAIGALIVQDTDAGASSQQWQFVAQP